MTIFGESAGGSLVSLLMASPRAEGLFHRAISESGPLYPLVKLRATPGETEPSAEDWGREFARKAGVREDDLTALRALSAETILALGSGHGANTGPVLDGTVFTMQVSEAFRRGAQAKVPYLVGSNDYEGGLLAPLVKRPDFDTETLARFKHIYDPDGRLDVHLVWQLAAGDALMVAPARRMARYVASAGVPSFLYAFTYVPPSVQALTAGAWHGAEVNYVFGSLLDRSAAHGVPTEADEDISRRMRAYWIAFARTGNPNHPRDPHWPAYSAAHDETMVFSNRGPTVVKDYAKARLDFQDEQVQQ